MGYTLNKYLGYLLILVASIYISGVLKGEFSFDSYIKMSSVYYKTPEILDKFTERDYLGQNSSIIRGRALYEYSKISFETAYELSPTITTDSSLESIASVAGVAPSYRVIDFDETLFEGNSKDNLYLYHNLDRLNITLSLKYFDISIGRQSIAFGYAKVLTSLDIFSPFTFQDFNKEEKKGVDSIKIVTPLGDMSQIEIGAIFGDSFYYENDSFYLKYKGYILNTDFSIMFNHFRENGMFAIDFTRNLFDSTIIFEAAYTIPKYIDNYSGDSNYFRATLGIDYQFSNEIFISVEYQFSSAGSNNSITLENIILPTKSTAYTEGGVYLFNKHYLSLLFSYPITPLLSISLNTLVNITEIACYNIVKLEYNIKENLYLDLSLQAPVSKNDSEFSYYPFTTFLSVRLYN
ncbi:hypothetical protein JXR93_02760 [bacterium]|nr:hypothetical protein [bacterium]